MDFIAEDGGKSLHSNCPTLLLPALSIGNVGQLAVDLLVSSLGAERVGFLDHPSILPCVGNNAFRSLPHGHLALPLEVYDSPRHVLSIVQQRSPVVKGMMLEFAKNLAEFASSAGKKHVIVMSSLDSKKKPSTDLNCSQIYYLSNANGDGSNNDCEKLGWKRISEYKPSERGWTNLSYLAEGNPRKEEFLTEDDMVDDDYFPSLPFAALFSCCEVKGLKVTCILSYCSEGDNIPDSFLLAEAACTFLGLTNNDFCENNVSRSVYDTGAKAAGGERFSNGSEKCSVDTLTRLSSPSLTSRRDSLLDADFNVVENKKSKVLCTFYAKGWCVKGNTCAFIHHKSCDDGEMTKTPSGEMSGKGEVREVAGSENAVNISAVGTMNSWASKNLLTSRLLVQEYGRGLAKTQFEPLPRRDLLHNHNIQGSDWSSDQSVRDLKHSSSRREHSNVPASSMFEEYADENSSSKFDVGKGYYRQDVSLKRGSSPGASESYDKRYLLNGFQIHHDQSRIELANTGRHFETQLHGSSTVNSRFLGGEKEYPFWKSYSATQNVSPFLSSRAHARPFSPGVSTQSLSTDWTPSVPFRSSVCPIAVKPSTGNQYDPFRDSAVSLSGVNGQTAASASSQETKPKDFVAINALSEDRNKDMLMTEQVIAKDAMKNKVSNHKHPKKLASRKVKRLSDQNKKSSKRSDSLELDTTATSQKDSKSLKLFTVTLVEYVKELMRPSWREGHLTKDAHKTIVKKSVDKVLNTLQPHQVPHTKVDADEYLSLARPKLAKLIEGYIEKYSKASTNRKGT